MNMAFSTAVVVVLYLSSIWLSFAEDKKMCFSLVEEGRLEAVESDVKRLVIVEDNIKTLRGILTDNSKYGYCGCSHYLVSGVYGVKDSQITASTYHGSGWEAQRGRLYDLADRTSRGQNCWVARTSNNQEYIQVHLNGLSRITGVVTQGRRDTDQWLTTYKLLYSVDGSAWTTIKNDLGKDHVFKGNYDRETPVTNYLERPVTARYVPLQVLTWHNFISMRFDVIGCPIKSN